MQCGPQEYCLCSAFLYHLSGREDLAVENFQAAVGILEERIREVPYDNCYHSSLAIAYAALGRRESALHELEEAVRLRHLSEDAMYGTSPLFDAVIVSVFLGEMDHALEQFEYLLSIPSPYSVIWAEWYPPLAPLEREPGFAALQKRYPVE